MNLPITQIPVFKGTVDHVEIRGVFRGGFAARNGLHDVRRTIARSNYHETENFGQFGFDPVGEKIAASAGLPED